MLQIEVFKSHENELMLAKDKVNAFLKLHENDIKVNDIKFTETFNSGSGYTLTSIMVIYEPIEQTKTKKAKE